MGSIAARLADRVIVTSDNPRSEAPEDIIADILPGLTGHADWRQETDRERAIVGALNAAVAGDVILIAGKGHEDYQEVHGERRAFDDRAVVRRWLGGDA